MLSHRPSSASHSATLQTPIYAPPLRVQSLAGYGLEVPELDVAERFFTDFGLRAEHTGGALQLHSQTSTVPNIVVIRGPYKRLHHLAFAILPADLPRFAEHLRRMGTTPLSPPFGALREGLWFQDPWNTWVNLAPLHPNPQASGPLPSGTQPASQPSPSPHNSTATATTAATDKAHASRPADRPLWRTLERRILPSKLGHLLIFTPDWERSETFYAQALGLRVTDRAAHKVSFMAAGNGLRDHHCFGLINHSHRGLQHSSFHVNSVDDVGLGALQMHRAGHTQGFGVGRHAIASNLFHYTRDPWGSWIEYYSDMDQISEAWVSQDWNELPYIWPHWAPEFWNHEMNANLEPTTPQALYEPYALHVCR